MASQIPRLRPTSRPAAHVPAGFEQLEPRTLLSGPGHYRHVLILSIDGLHQADLVDMATRGNFPNVRALARTGVTYTNAHSATPADSFPGTLAYLTGAHPRTTGVYYDVSYDRTLTAAGGTSVTPRGTTVEYAETIDKNSNLLSGGGDYGFGSIDPAKLPLDFTDGNGSPVYPHEYLKVNTIFEVAHQAGLHTAFNEKHPAYDIAAGPSGTGIDDFYAPEIDAKVALVNGQLVDASTAPAGTPLAKTTKKVSTTEAYDDLKVQAVLNEIDGNTARGTADAPVPALFAMNFQAVSVGQKLPSGGIDLAADGSEVVSADLANTMSHTDASVGRIINELKARGLFSSTLVILTAKHGQTPRIGPASLVGETPLTDALAAKGIEVAQATQDDSALIWLKDSSQAAGAAAALEALKGTADDPGIDRVLFGPSLAAAGLASDAAPQRTPDLVVVMKPGVIFADSGKRAEHGGFSTDDTSVPLILGGGSLRDARVIRTDVQSTQIAVTALQALRLDARQLQGAVAEHTRPLPFFGDDGDERGDSRERRNDDGESGSHDHDRGSRRENHSVWAEIDRD